jgi:DNA repair protein RadD
MLRPYQQKALDEIRGLYRQNKKRVLLHLSTGGGKTVIFCEILKNCYQKNKHGIMLVRGRKLVDQASQRLIREGVPHGVLMAGHWNYNPKELIQICSIDTVSRRMNEIKKADMIVVDEVHMAAAETFKKFLAQFPDAYKLGVTATPYQRATINHIAEHVVKPITMVELIEQGYLVPAKYYAPSQPDLTGVKIKSSTGDYDEEQLEARCNKIIGDLATNWKRYGENRPTVCFAINIHHSKNIVAHLTENGIPAAHVDADSTDMERQDVLDKLEKGELKIVSNVGILCTGVDLPFLSCIMMARPTMSLNLYIQQLGRATRPYENKTDFIVLDHGNNVARHGFITTEREAVLEFKKTGKMIGVPPVATCEKCYAVFPVQTKVCPQCGHVNEKADRKIVEINGELQLLTDEQYEKFKINIRFHELKRIQKEKDYKRGWVFHKMKDEFGETVAQEYVPRREVPDWV